MLIDSMPLGPRKPIFSANYRDSLAQLYRKQGRLDLAEEYARKNLETNKDSSAQTHRAPLVAGQLCRINAARRRYAEARTQMTRVIGLFPEARPIELIERSRLAWAAGDRQMAIANLAQAMDAAKHRRSRPGGDKVERAYLFGRDADAFDLMVARQADLGHAAEAFAACLNVSRTLVDGPHGAERGRSSRWNSRRAAANLKKRELEARLRLAGLEKRLALAIGAPDNVRSSSKRN